MEFNTKSKLRPRQFIWCGSDSVVAYWDQLETGTILMVGPGSKWLNYAYDDRVILAPELDGLRVISKVGRAFTVLPAQGGVLRREVRG